MFCNETSLIFVKQLKTYIMKESKKVKKTVKKVVKKEVVKEVPADVKELLMFGAEWCGPCRQMKQKLGVTDSNTATELPNDIKFIYHDVSEADAQKLAKELKVRNVPTFVHKLNGEIVEDKIVGIATIERLTEKFQ